MCVATTHVTTVAVDNVNSKSEGKRKDVKRNFLIILFVCFVVWWNE